MRVARVEAEGDAPARLAERGLLRPDRPVAGERPLAETQPLRRLVGASFAPPVAEVRLGRLEVVPVGVRLDAAPFDGDGLALDAEQLLDHALRVLVAPLAEVVVADDAI